MRGHVGTVYVVVRKEIVPVQLHDHLTCDVWVTELLKTRLCVGTKSSHYIITDLQVP